MADDQLSILFLNRGASTRADSDSDDDEYSDYDVNSDMDMDSDDGGESEHHTMVLGIVEAFVEKAERGRKKKPEPDVFDRLPFLKDIDPFDDDVEPPSPERFLQQKNRTSVLLNSNAEAPPAVAFLNMLESLGVDELDEHDRVCRICMESYHDGQEVPVALPCGHVFGKHCLEDWLSEFSAEQHDSCPTCRKCHVRVRENIGTEVGLRQRLQDVDYLLMGAGPLRLNEEGLQQWETVKGYVQEHLEECDERRKVGKETFEKWRMDGGMWIEKMQEELKANFEIRATFPTSDGLAAFTEMLIRELAGRGIGPEIFDNSDDEVAGDEEIGDDAEIWVSGQDIRCEDCGSLHTANRCGITDSGLTDMATDTDQKVELRSSLSRLTVQCLEDGATDRGRIHDHEGDAVGLGIDTQVGFRHFPPSDDEMNGELGGKDEADKLSTSVSIATNARSPGLSEVYEMYDDMADEKSTTSTNAGVDECSDLFDVYEMYENA